LIIRPSGFRELKSSAPSSAKSHPVNAFSFVRQSELSSSPTASSQRSSHSMKARPEFRIRTEDGRVVDAQANCLRHIDYGYASTSHSSQGATVDRVIVNIDTMRSAELVNRKQFYVSISRARYGISVYTDDRERLSQVVNRSREKSTALERIPSKCES
jgi:ATP-dependent exoDNAse (exonuclease V) alpha subunit